MCEPTTIMAVMAVASMATTALGIKAGNDQASAQAQAASNAAASDYLQQTTQQEQINAQAALEKTERARQAMIERAKLRVSQGDAGIDGLSPMREEANTYMNESYDASIIETNRSSRIRQLQVEKNATQENAQGRINAARSNMTSGWASGLQIGMSALTGGVQGYSLGKSFNSSSPLKYGDTFQGSDGKQTYLGGKK